MRRGLILFVALLALGPPWAAAAAAPGAAAAAAPGVASDDDGSAPVLPGVPLQFPRDFGSHPQFGIEWWYVTGWLYTAARRPLGFQITFFRVRPAVQSDNPSAFTAHQLLIAHCALSDPMHGRLWQAQRIRRAGLGLAEAALGNTDVWMDGWRLQRLAGPTGGADVYSARVDAEDFDLQLTFTASEPPMRNGVNGFSQKGPALRSASDYYSVPQLRVAGTVQRAGRSERVTGEAWLDHEWASEYLDPRAQGWDWVGLNLADGGAAMAFEIRDRQGRPYWAGGTLRDAHGHTRALAPGQIGFTPLSWWRSPRSGVRYPVAERVRIGAQQYELTPLMDDQELDARLTSGALYWEGAVSARPLGAPSAERGSVGRGYLELTGYDRPLSLR